MKILLLGAGGVGESLAVIAGKHDREGAWLKLLVVADRYIENAQEVTDRLVGMTGAQDRFIPETVNALHKDEIVALAQKYGVDLIITCLDSDPFNPIVMDACLACNCHYMDMGLMLTERDPDDSTKIVKLLGEEQFKKSADFEGKGLYAICGCGVEPGMSDFFARYAEKYFFDELYGLYTRDGSNLSHPTNSIPFGFSIFQSAIECNLGPVLWDRETGFHSAPPLSSPEDFWLPGGIGTVRMTAIEHSEPMNMARHIGKGLRETNFKIGFGEAFEVAMKNLKDLGMINMDKVKVGDVEVCPLDVLGVTAPNPKEIGRELVGRTCAGVWVTGRKDGMERQIYLYQYSDNEECVEKLGCQAVVAQTAVTPAIVARLLAEGRLDGPHGVRVCEEFDPDPVLALLGEYGFPAGLLEMESEYREAKERKAFLAPITGE
jgi:saccharopine dehydrogenase-like NADP-dependent oxidoreductase